MWQTHAFTSYSKPVRAGYTISLQTIDIAEMHSNQGFVSAFG